MQSWLTFELDGETCRVENESSRITLAQFLSNFDPLYGHYADGNPWHGGSPVIWSETNGYAPRFRAVDAHLLLLPMVADGQIWTPEGISNLDPGHPAVRVLNIDHVECGAARKMAILSLFFEGYYRCDMRRLGQLNEQFDSLVSRTTNFISIRDAAKRLFANTETKRHQASQTAAPGQQNEVWTGKKDIFKDRFTKKLFQKRSPEDLDYVDQFKRLFHRPKTMVELKRHLSAYPDAKIIAGGTSVFESLDPTDFKNLISVDDVNEMQTISNDQDLWEIGAGVNLTRIGESLGLEFPALLKALSKFASRPVRNRATLGGYLAQASDIGQLAPLLLTLDTRVNLVSPEGQRDASLAHFYEGGGRTILRPQEFIQSIIIPRGTPAALANRGMTARICDTYTVGSRKSLCDPFVTGSFALEIRETTVAKAWIAYTGVADRPVRARRAEEALVGKVWCEDTVFNVSRGSFVHFKIDKQALLIIELVLAK